jgi:two-component system, NarL family, nitrate/nitrite response regulator NarL
MLEQVRTRFPCQTVHETSVPALAEQLIFSLRDADVLGRVMDAIRILVVAERMGFAQGLLIALRRRSGFDVLGPLSDESAVIELLAEARPDLVVVDLDRSDGRGLLILAAVRDEANVPAMVATRDTSAGNVELALVAGACGVLPVDGQPASLASAVRRAVAGELVLPVDDLSASVGRLREARTRRGRHAALATLTQREREVITGFARGASISGIAVELGISRSTVQTHVKNILRKLGVHSTIEAVGVAWRAGLAVDTRSA